MYRSLCTPSLSVTTGTAPTTRWAGPQKSSTSWCAQSNVTAAKFLCRPPWLRFCVLTAGQRLVSVGRTPPGSWIWPWSYIWIWPWSYIWIWLWPYDWICPWTYIYVHGSDHGFTYGSDHGLTFGSDHGLMYGCYRGLAYRSDHGLIYRSDHRLTYGSDHGLAYGLTVDLHVRPWI